MFRLIYLHYGLILSSCLFPVAQQRELNCQLARVIDGDTVYLKRGNGQIKLRLIYIDALEKGQIKGEDLAKSYLRKFVGRKLTCTFIKKGYYGRWLGEIHSIGKSLNLELVKKGLVYLYPYSKFETEFQKLKYVHYFKKSQTQNKGIFKSFKYLKPWVYRKKHRLKKDSHPQVSR